MAITLSSSPVWYPPSSSPPPVVRKRKLFQHTEAAQPKKPRTVGGFLDDDEEEDERIEKVTATADTANPTLVSKGVSLAALEALCEDESEEVRSPNLPFSVPDSERRGQIDGISIQSCSGGAISLRKRARPSTVSYEHTIASRSTHVAGRAKTSYYGIEIHKILDEVKASQKEREATRVSKERLIPSVEPLHSIADSKVPRALWTEKYRAMRFTDLVGDERSHRSVLRWFKSWDDTVFPGHIPRPTKRKPFSGNEEEQHHKKILMLTGPPGLGKTTLAHVCAKQAGYEVLEINASDDRSRDVVKGRIKDALGTENVRGIDVKRDNKTVRKAGRPVCVVVDEVDGVTTGSGAGGEGGFMKALADLVQLDQQNSTKRGLTNASKGRSRKDSFRMQRPLILICNDVYHPSLRPLRASNMAEVVHLRNPPIEKVILRLKGIFETEGVSCDFDAIRRLCEATWGVTSRKEGQMQKASNGEGDIRSVLVTGEWIAQKLRYAQSSADPIRLTRKWFEESVLKDGQQFSSHLKGLGRGGVREIIDRVFLDGAGLPSQPAITAKIASAAHIPKMADLGVADLRKRQAINHLREMIETCGEHERCVVDSFSTYPSQAFQDDTFLSKPSVAQEWELSPYLSQSVLAFHHLFASVAKSSWNADAEALEQSEQETHPFSGVRADFAAHEAEKQNRASSSEFLASFPSPLMRIFRSVDAVSSELLPYVCRILSPDVKPVVVGGAGSSVASVRKDVEKKLVQSAIRVMDGLHVNFEKVKVEMERGAQGGFAYRMEPALDTLSSYHLGTSSASVSNAPVRYALRQVLEQECRKEALRQRSKARLDQAMSADPSQQAVNLQDAGNDKENAEGTSKKSSGSRVKRDFFGRVIVNEQKPGATRINLKEAAIGTNGKETRTWVSYHEGYSNAVRKPITLKELMDSM
ncbi:MAG: hypothetical protein Q9227_001570 [Pyrenula ochraceoflavens]